MDYTDKSCVPSRDATLSVAMSVSKWSERLERCVWSFLLACGTFPLRFDAVGPGRFFTSRKRALYCIGITVVYAVLSPALMYLIYEHERMANVYLVSMLNAAQLSFIYLFMIVVNVRMLSKAQGLASTLNALFAIRNTILQQWNCRVLCREYGKLLLYKVLAIDMALLLFSLIMYYVTQDEVPTGAEVVVGVTFSVFRYVFTALVNLYLVGLMIVSFIQGSINSKLTSLVDRSGEEKPSTIREVYMVHCENAQLEKQFMAIMDLPVLLLNGWYFYMIVVSVYYMYTSTMLEVRRGFGVEDVTKYFNSVTFFLYLAVQLYYMMSIPSQYTERSKKMLSILGAINHRSKGPRMERMLDFITLDYMQRDYDVRNYGLYDINRALLFGTIATVTSYVIILVQFHMQQYG
uniref:uncharacterized protein LOC120948949 n=1 Tax=Anopheles coluzzii TaxID=1518534 RepID=UPI0020FF8735|nr:uncharacterized protein LOC120948949 [Anopheles coluzzii]